MATDDALLLFSEAATAKRNDVLASVHELYARAPHWWAGQVKSALESLGEWHDHCRNHGTLVKRKKSGVARVGIRLNSIPPNPLLPQPGENAWRDMPHARRIALSACRMLALYERVHPNLCRLIQDLPSDAVSLKVLLCADLEGMMVTEAMEYLRVCREALAADAERAKPTVKPTARPDEHRSEGPELAAVGNRVANSMTLKDRIRELERHRDAVERIKDGLAGEELTRQLQTFQRPAVRVVADLDPPIVVGWTPPQQGEDELQAWARLYSALEKHRPGLPRLSEIGPQDPDAPPGTIRILTTPDGVHTFKAATVLCLCAMIELLHDRSSALLGGDWLAPIREVTGLVDELLQHMRESKMVLDTYSRQWLIEFGVRLNSARLAALAALDEALATGELSSERANLAKQVLSGYILTKWHRQSDGGISPIAQSREVDATDVDRLERDFAAMRKDLLGQEREREAEAVIAAASKPNALTIDPALLARLEAGIAVVGSLSKAHDERMARVEQAVKSINVAEPKALAGPARTEVVLWEGAAHTDRNIRLARTRSAYLEAHGNVTDALAALKAGGNGIGKSTLYDHLKALDTECPDWRANVLVSGASGNPDNGVTVRTREKPRAKVR